MQNDHPLTRYDLMVDSENRPMMTEVSDGEFVLYSDVKRLSSGLLPRWHQDLLVEALAEIKASVDGHSDQTIPAILDGILAEIAAHKEEKQ